MLWVFFPNIKGLLLILQLRNYSSFRLTDQKRSDIGQEVGLRRIQLPEPDGKRNSVRRPALPNRRRKPQLLPVQLDHEM